MKSRGKKLILWLLAAALMIGAMPAAVLGDEKDMEIPPVYHRDDDNETVRIVIGKTPNITIGKTSTISVAVKNTSASLRKASLRIIMNRSMKRRMGISSKP